jgi:hypothetical protein
MFVCFDYVTNTFVLVSSLVNHIRMNQAIVLHLKILGLYYVFCFRFVKINNLF